MQGLLEPIGYDKIGPEKPARRVLLASLREKRGLVHLLVVVLYTVLSLILTYPLVTHFSTHVLGTDIWAFDEYTFIWNMWWFKYSLLDLHSSPLFSNHIFYPLGISLVPYTYNLFNALMSLPLQPFLTLSVISNLMNLFAFTMSGYGTYLLLRYLLQDHERGQKEDSLRLHCAAFVAGLVYSFTSYHFVYAALGHHNMVTIEWIPFYTLFVIKTVREARWRNALMGGVFATLTLLSEPFLGVFLATLTLVVFIFAGRRSIFSASSLKRFGVLLLVTAITSFPLGYPLLKELLSADYAMSGWGHSERLLVDLFGFFTPTALHPILGGDWSQELTMVREGTARFTDVNTVFLGWIVIILAIFASVRYWNRVKAWTVGAVASAILAMGPLLHINGRSSFDLDGLLVHVPLPFILLHYIPVVKANRVPNRFSCVLMLCLAVLVGFAAHAVVRRVKRGALQLGVTALLGVLVTFEHLSTPMPLTCATVPDWYYTLASEPGDFAILEFPLGWRNSFGVFGVERTQAQYYQSIHHKRLPSGNISRNPPFKFDYFRGLPIFDSIAQLELYQELDTDRIEQDRLTADELVYFFDLRYLVFQPIVPNRPPYCDTRPRVEEYVQQVFPVEKIYEDERGLTVYRVTEPEAQSELQVDFGSDAAKLYQGEGWSRDEVIGEASANWAEAQRARLFFPLRHSGDCEMSLRALAFVYDGSPAQTVRMTINGIRLPETLSVGPYWDTHTVGLPGQYLKAGLNEVLLEFAYAASPHDVLPGNFTIGNTGVTSPVEITVNSAGLRAGDFAYITVEAQDASTHRRGYNLAVIHPQTGAIVDKAGFDTWANEFESQELADFVSKIPGGYIVAVGVKDDGAANLTEGAVQALRSLGGETDLRGTEYLSHAIIGVKGAAPGTALEASGDANSYLHVGSNPDERTLAVALDYVHFDLR